MVLGLTRILQRGLSTLVRMAKPNVVFVLGGPGAGKGTQCDLIVKEFGYVHLSAGDLLRAERKREGSKVGEEIEMHIQNGTIVPVEITCGLLDQAMQRSSSKNFLIDGFPRNEDNLSGWNRTMSNKINLKFILFFDCPEETCVTRCLNRGAQGSGRSDDNKESMEKRIKTYNLCTMPIIDHYAKMNMVRTVDGSKSPEDVFSEVKKIFTEYN